MRQYILPFLLAGVLHAGDPWTVQDTARESVVLSLSLADWGQTLDVRTRYQAGARCWEANPLLGAHPSRARINRYFAAGLVLHPLIAYLLPARARHAFQYVSIGWEAGIVGSNAHLGFQIRF